MNKPKYLYRYCRLPKKSDRKYRLGTKGIFTKNQIFLSSPLDFNDPFDCKSLFNISNANEADWRKYYNQMFRHQHPNWSPSRRKKEVDKYIETEAHKQPELLEEQRQLWHDVMVGQADTIGMLCLSEKPDDILMWSHYGDGHKGFCLQFNLQELRKPTIYCEPVQYYTNYPTFEDFLACGLKSKADLSLIRKSDHWDYEKEWRIIVNASKEDRNRPFKLPESSLCGVILGCEMNTDDKNAISSWIEESGKDISIFHAHKSDTSYDIIIPDLNQ